MNDEEVKEADASKPVQEHSDGDKPVCSHCGGDCGCGGASMPGNPEKEREEAPQK